MTGAGFGGCAVALVKKEEETNFVKNVSECYFNKKSLAPDIISCTPADGVSIYDPFTEFKS